LHFLSFYFAVVEELEASWCPSRAGSDATAASGRKKELSEWQRSARDEGFIAEDIRWEPQQESAKRGASGGIRRMQCRTKCSIALSSNLDTRTKKAE